MSAKLTLILKSLVCHVTKADVGSDTVRIKVNGEDHWGSFEMNNGHTHHFVGTSLGYLPVWVTEGEEIEIRLKGDKVWYIEPSGEKTIKAKTGDYVAVSRAAWSLYSLFFSIERNEAPVKLEIVRPSLGHPMICKPEDLDAFKVTLATRSVVGDIDKAFFALLEGNIVLEDVETGEKWPCKLKDVNLWDLRKQITSNRARYMQKREELNEKPDRFPRSNAAFRAGCGILTDFDVKVKPSVEDISELAGVHGWPRMFNLRLGESVACHCIFVSETLPETDKIKFLHVTDTHVAVINDTIAKHIREYPEIHECEKGNMLRDYRNPNDHLRAIIRYANKKEIDFVVITGDLINLCSDGWFKWKSREQTNFRKFQQIITGADSLSERLRCPLFFVPGNHDFYPFGIPLHFEIDPYLLDDLGWKDPVERNDELVATGLQSHVYTLKKMGNYYNTKAYEKNKLSPSPVYAFMVNTYPQFFQYLMEMSYDVSFTANIGKHHLVLLNTGQDIGLLSKAKMVEKETFGTHLDYLQGGSQCIGFSGEDRRILKNVMKKQDGQTGLVLVFTHAPLVHLEKHPDKDDKLEIVFEDNHKTAKPPPPVNEITKFLIKLEPGDVNPLFPGFELQLRGYPQGGTKYFYCFPQGWFVGKRDQLIDFACADGASFKEVMQLITGTHPDIHRYCANVVVFSGHTHHVHEYRATGPQELGQEGPCIYAENYSGSEEWTKLPEGHKPDQLPQNQRDLAAWRWMYAPLLLISGSLKGKEYPEFREVHVEGIGLNAGIRTMQMRQIDRLDQKSMAGMQYLYASESVGLAPFPKFVDVENFPELNSLDSCVHIRQALDPLKKGTIGSVKKEVRDYNERYLVMSNLMGKHLSVYRALGGAEVGIAVKAEKQLFQYAEYLFSWEKFTYPGWYDGYPGWIRERNQDREHIDREVAASLIALFYSGMSVRLNRYGVDFGYAARNSLDLQGHYEWARNMVLSDNFQRVQKETENRVKRLFEFAEEAPNRLLCMWFASESTYLAKLGSYKITERNQIDPSIHMNWALSLTPEVVLMDMIVKYQLQAENQFFKSGIEGLKRFCSVSAARLSSWGANCADGGQGDSVNPE
ncbi:MAG: metallophosphoesterase, partial [Campylobacterota bacterium]|nr:metallophosphoesterase [Campylobacterota bacterium]